MWSHDPDTMIASCQNPASRELWPHTPRVAPSRQHSTALFSIIRFQKTGRWRSRKRSAIPEAMYASLLPETSGRSSGQASGDSFAWGRIRVKIGRVDGLTGEEFVDISAILGRRLFENLV